MTAAPSETLTRLSRTLADVEHLGRTSGHEIDPRSVRKLMGILSALIGEAMGVLGHLPAARSWYDTALTAADASEDDCARADVRALAALTALNYDRLGEARSLSGQAQTVAGGSACLASTLAPVVAALALARSGNTDHARDLFGLAKTAFARTGPEQRCESALGCAPGRLLFFEGRLLTAMGEFTSAWQIHQRALALYSRDVVVDRFLIYLDRSVGLICSGYPDDGAELVTATLLNLPKQHRSRFLLRSAHTVYETIPVRSRRLTAVKRCWRVLANLGGCALRYQHLHEV